MSEEPAKYRVQPATILTVVLGKDVQLPIEVRLESFPGHVQLVFGPPRQVMPPTA